MEQMLCSGDRRKREKIYYVVYAQYNEEISTAVPLSFMHNMSSVGKRVPKNRAYLRIGWTIWYKKPLSGVINSNLVDTWWMNPISVNTLQNILWNNWKGTQSLSE